MKNKTECEIISLVGELPIEMWEYSETIPYFWVTLGTKNSTISITVDKHQLEIEFMPSVKGYFPGWKGSYQDSNFFTNLMERSQNRDEIARIYAKQKKTILKELKKYTK